MVAYRIVFSTKAEKHKKLVVQGGFEKRVRALLGILAKDPLQNPPPYEKLIGDLTGCYSRRINHQHRLIYEIYEKEKTVRILSMWTHYET